MKKTQLKAGAALLLSATLALPLAVQAQNIAVVNGKPVPKARAEAILKQVTEQAGKQGQQLPPDLDQRVRDSVVLGEIFTQEAEKRGLASSADYRSQMEQARQQVLTNALFADFAKANPVAEADVKAEYDKFKAQSAGTEYRARHILVEKEDEAKKLIADIKAGGKFEELAKKNSKDPGSGANGGDLDFAAANAYVPEFSQAMAKLKKGEMTQEPVKTQFGFHIIRLDDTREAQFPPYDDVKAQLKQRMEQQKLAAFRDEIRVKAKTDYKFSN
ncbi:MAG: peptidylprolyl isomerase [Rhizobiales bacterium]|nr:peptidylprolyl isomerase [Rhizobacter sp.]